MVNSPRRLAAAQGVRHRQRAALILGDEHVQRAAQALQRRLHLRPGDFMVGAPAQDDPIVSPAAGDDGHAGAAAGAFIHIAAVHAGAGQGP